MLTIAAMTPEELARRRRRNILLALVHVAVAIGIMAAFMYAQTVR